MPDFVRAVLDNPELAEFRGKFEKIIFGNRIVEKNMINLFPFIFWVGEFSCKITIVGKKKYPKGV